MNSFRINLMIQEHESRINKIQSSIGVVCAECNQEPYYFNTKNNDFYEKKTCLICSKKKTNGILLEDFLFTLTRKIKNHYELTNVSDPNKVSIKEVLKRFTYNNDNVLEKLSFLVCKADQDYFQFDGYYKSTIDENFITKCKDDAIKKWNTLADELKHVRRFTHTKASIFYESLISACIHKIKKDEVFNAALTIVDEGSIFYRARLVKDAMHKNLIVSSPEKELSAPPNYLATNSRMSPPGISFMYTAGDHRTAIAEIRPYVDDIIAVGTFQNIKKLNFFDFTLLEKMHHIDANILENPKKDQYFQNKFILRELHKLISKPSRAVDISYLETQMFAETIRNYKNGMFDGIIFGSSQRHGGLNYVLFGETSDFDDLSITTKNYHVEIKEKNKVDFYKITKMNATSKKLIAPKKPSS